MIKRDSGRLGFVLSLLLFAASAVASFLFFPEGRPGNGDFGICLPSPNHWDLLPVWSAAIADGILLLTAILLIFYNNRFNFTQSPAWTAPVVFLLLCSACPWMTLALGSTQIMVLVNLVSLWMLFGRVDKRGAVPEYFLVASFLSIGSMAQYAFVALIPFYALAGILLRVFRWKEFLAMLLGVAAPYWCAVGLGLVRLEDFHFPSFALTFPQWTQYTALLTLCIFLGAVAILAICLCLSNFIRLYSANSGVRRMNHVFYLFTVWTVGFMLIDFTNFLAYAATLFMLGAVEVGVCFGLSSRDTVAQGRNSFALLVLALVCIALYLFLIL